MHTGGSQCIAQAAATASTTGTGCACLSWLAKAADCICSLPLTAGSSVLAVSGDGRWLDDGLSGGKVARRLEGYLTYRGEAWVEHSGSGLPRCPQQLCARSKE